LEVRLEDKKVKMTTGFKISQLESQMRDKERLLRELLPTKTKGDRSLFREISQELKKLSSQVYKLRKDIPKRNVYNDLLNV
jgi:hypothetical protein